MVLLLDGGTAHRALSIFAETANILPLKRVVGVSVSAEVSESGGAHGVVFAVCDGLFESAAHQADEGIPSLSTFMCLKTSINTSTTASWADGLYDSIYAKSQFTWTPDTSFLSATVLGCCEYR